MEVSNIERSAVGGKKQQVEHAHQNMLDPFDPPLPIPPMIMMDKLLNFHWNELYVIIILFSEDRINA